MDKGPDEEKEMNTRRKKKLVHEGQYVAEVEVEVLDTDTDGHHLSLEDAYKLDEVRSALRRGDIKAASAHARVYAYSRSWVALYLSCLENTNTPGSFIVYSARSSKASKKILQALSEGLPPDSTKGRLGRLADSRIISRTV
jgi:hypothetical protein